MVRVFCVFSSVFVFLFFLVLFCCFLCSCFVFVFRLGGGHLIAGLDLVGGCISHSRVGSFDFCFVIKGDQVGV